MNSASQNSIETPSDSSLNDAQRLRLRVGCQYIDKLLSAIEDILHATESKSPFPKYQVDVNLAQVRVLEDYIRQFRARLLRTLAWQGIVVPAPEIPATRAIGVNLTFIDITLADLRPSAMRGSGALPEKAASELSGVVHELASFTESMVNYVRRELADSLRDRIATLREDEAVRLLRKIEEVVTRQGLVQYRPRLEALLTRLEDQTFEIAVFGRVSSGKSSFLNAVLEQDLLPVGVNPITAIPTRISFGERVQAFIRYGSGDLVETTLEEFRSLISERSNPGNERAITRAAIRVPSPLLAYGVVLVDTPGLGSLARRGGAETLAYLPSCDLALVLVDAGSTLTEEDIATIRLVREAGIPAIVLLSKCDLLNSEDVQHTVDYVLRKLSEQLRNDFTVLPISSLPDQRCALEEFIQRTLMPSVEQAAQLKSESIGRKLQRLLGDVSQALRTRIDQTARRAEISDPERTRTLEGKLRSIGTELAELAALLERSAMGLYNAAPRVIESLAQTLVDVQHDGDDTGTAIPNLVQGFIEAEVAPLLTRVQRSIDRVVQQTLSVGEDIGQTDLPDEHEFDALLREAPHFELALPPIDTSPGAWRLLGGRLALARLQHRLSEQIGSTLSAGLMNYGRLFESWARSIARAVTQTIEPYLQAYRSVLTTDSPMSQPDENALEDLRVLAGENELIAQGGK